ncbi:MAG TPA: fibronectin type III domain-containing protein, partial [Polyangiaceae bacterium]
KAALATLLRQARGYVQSVADGDAATSAAVIASANIAVRKTAVRPLRGFHVVQAAVSGAAKLVVPAAGHRASYDWEYSPDGGKTWVGAPSTLTASTSIAGLPAGTSVQFRYRALTKAGVGDWSQPTSLLVK